MTNPLPRFRPDGFLRRQDMLLLTELELQLRLVALAVEAAGCHTLLTDASVLIQQARNKVADWLEDANA